MMDHHTHSLNLIVISKCEYSIYIIMAFFLGLILAHGVVYEVTKRWLLPGFPKLFY